MSYQEIELENIEDSPFQTRLHFNDGALAGIMSTASDHLGIRYAPIVRPHPTKNGVYQIASGHGRILALRALGKKTTMVRIADLSDKQMKVEILVENVNRSDLEEGERFQAIEAIRLDPDTDDSRTREMLANKENGWITELSRRTGIKRTTLSDIYDVKEVRDILRKEAPAIAEKITAGRIRASAGLDKKDRTKLLVKADEKEWSRPAVTEVKRAIQKLDPQVRETILKQDQSLTPNIIKKISELEDSGAQVRVIKQIQTQGLDERLALQRIQRLKTRENLDLVTLHDEAGEILEDFKKTADTIRLWGINHYMILGEQGWSEASEIFDEIEKQIRWLKQAKFLDNVT